MSSRSKTLIGGALAVIFVITMVNTNAIVSLSNRVERSLGDKVSYSGSVMPEYYVGDQRASVLPGVGDEIFYPEPEDPEGGGVYEVFFANGLCATISETASNPGTTYIDTNGQLRCNVGVVGPSSGDSNIIQVNPVTGQLIISGTSATATTAMKLHALGYVNQSKMAPWPPGNISEMLKVFQRDNGISQTGTVDKLTIAALDARVASLRVWKTEMKYKISSQDHIIGRQQAALGTTMGTDIPEPGGGGYLITVYTNNFLENTCTATTTNTETGQTYGITIDGLCGTGVNTNDPILNMINFQTREGRATGNGTLATATKLSLLGYMSGQSKMAPWPPTNIAEEIKAFQRDNGISQTGTAGPLTTAALDAKIANLRAELVETKYWVSSYEDIIKGTNSTR